MATGLNGVAGHTEGEFRAWLLGRRASVEALVPLREMSRAEVVGISVAVALLFAVQTWYAFLWDSLRVYQQYNVIFDTDPNDRLYHLAHGWTVGNFNHPLFAYFFSIPIRILDVLGQSLRLVTDSLAFRRDLGIMVPPLMTALKIPAFYLTFRRLGLNWQECALATGFGVLAFSSVVFGSIPDSYGLTGAGVVLVFLAAVLVSAQQVRRGWTPLVAAGVFATGITISNVIVLGWAIWARAGIAGMTPRRALGTAIIFAGLIGGLVLATNFALSFVRLSEPAPPAPNTELMAQFTPSPSEQIERLIRFPEILGRSFLPTMPDQKPNLMARRLDNPITFETDYVVAGPGGWLLGAASLLIFGGGAVVAWRRGGAWRWTGLAAGLSVVMMGGLYSLWGATHFLYSQHFQAPAAILAAAWLTVPALRQRGVYWVGALLLVYMAVRDIMILETIARWIEADLDRAGV